MSDKQEGEKPPKSDGHQPSVEFQTFFDGLEESQRTLIDGHVNGLKSALKSEREAAKALNAQLGELRGKLDGNAAALADLDKLRDNLSQSQAKAAFYEAASAAGVSNLRLAWLAVQQDEMIGDQGKVDFRELQENYPELFGAEAEEAAAYVGAGSKKVPKARSMDDLIRAKAR